MANRHRSFTANVGMTLVELMIVLVVVAVLAAVSWPSLSEFVNRSRRADAMSALSEVMQAQERWRANNPSYKGTLTDLPGARTTSRDGHYSLAIVADSASATTYTATATALSGSPQWADTRCRVLSVAINGGNITYGSSTSGGATNAQPDPCWTR
jgi:type IV pilus assembly protein PilE